MCNFITYNNELDSLKARLKLLLEAQVIDGCLLMWPTKYEETDVQLNLTLILSTGDKLSVTFLTGDNAQTPEIVYEIIEPKYKYADLSERKKLWLKGNQWEEIDRIIEKEGESYNIFETFDIKDSEEFEGIIGYKIIEIEIIYYAGPAPTGISLKFS